jgi:cytochrome c biogenesis protein CcdA
VQQDLVGLAFAAGLVAALNPCGFAMLPAYLALVVRGADTPANSESGSGGVLVALGRAAAATAAMALGFLAVFGTFGLLTVSLASTVAQYMPYATVLIGVALVVIGVLLLSGREIAVLLPNRLTGSAGTPTRRLGSMFGYGVAYALASLSCTIGPFLAVTGAGSVGGGPLMGRAFVYVAYAAGFGLVVGALAAAVALAGNALIERMRRILPYVNRIGGAILVLVGLYVGYYGFYEVRLFEAGGSPSDPVIAAAGRIQGALAGWVYRHGPWPWIVLLAILALAGLLWARRRPGRATTSRRRPFREDRATAADEP